MVDDRMRFCASTGTCGSQVTLGPSSRVRLAADRAATDDRRVDALRAFAAEKLSRPDMSRFDALLDDVLDDAERANPTQAQDGLPTAALREARWIARRRRADMAMDGRSPAAKADRDRMAAIFPHMNRIR